MHKKTLIILIVILFLIGVGVLIKNNATRGKAVNSIKPVQNQPLNPLAIEAMRGRNYPGSDLKIEQTLEDSENYRQYIASYLSEGLKIYGLLTIPLKEQIITYLSHPLI